MNRPARGLINAGPLAQIKEQGCTVVTGGGHAIAVFFHDGQVHAVDNRCPHMGFPLERGSVRDGILTCHWHHARFELSSGGTFNPFCRRRAHVSGERGGGRGMDRPRTCSPR